MKCSKSVISADATGHPSTMSEKLDGQDILPGVPCQRHCSMSPMV